MAMRNCHAPTTSSRVLFTCSEPMWDEELEQFEHVRKMAAISEEIESLKAMVGATQGISAMTAMTVAKLQLSANSGSSGKSNTTSSYSDANDNELWDEAWDARYMPWPSDAHASRAFLAYAMFSICLACVCHILADI